MKKDGYFYCMYKLTQKFVLQNFDRKSKEHTYYGPVAFDSRLLIASIQTFLIKNHNLIELRKPLILSYTNNCISITQKILFIKIIFSYWWETAMILYKKNFIYLKNNNENKNTMFNKTEIKKNILSFFFSKLALEMSYRYVFFT